MPLAARRGCYTEVLPAMPEPPLSVTADPLDARAVIRGAEQEAGEGRHGAVCVFIGNVRGEHLGRRVIELHYEAYEPLALSAFTMIAAEAGAAWPGVGVALRHRDSSARRRRAAAVLRCGHTRGNRPAETEPWLTPTSCSRAEPFFLLPGCCRCRRD